MSQQDQALIKQAYAAFNARDIDAVLSLMHRDVHWPNGWEGGYVNGHEEVRAYWTRQWEAIDPEVHPLAFKERPSGALEVQVHQLVKDLQGTVLLDGMVKHVYTLEQGKIKNMEIEKV
jgi:ketosteroid isomerase-like protein